MSLLFIMVKYRKRRSRCAGKKRKVCQSKKHMKRCRMTKRGKKKSHCRARRNRTRRMRKRASTLLSPGHRRTR